MPSSKEMSSPNQARAMHPSAGFGTQPMIIGPDHYGSTMMNYRFKDDERREYLGEVFKVS